jgi:hypothetical protein
MKTAPSPNHAAECRGEPRRPRRRWQVTSRSKIR